jgi:hypothetical protein
MVHMYCVTKGGENFKTTTCIKNFIDEHLNVCLLTIIVNVSKNISTLKFENTWIRYYYISKFLGKVK